jgi:hypothetical protein
MGNSTWHIKELRFLSKNLELKYPLKLKRRAFRKESTVGIRNRINW